MFYFLLMLPPFNSFSHLTLVVSQRPADAGGLLVASDSGPCLRSG